MFVLLALVGGGKEEFGWRGWLQSALQQHISPLLAAVIVGVVWAIWHLPLSGSTAPTTRPSRGSTCPPPWESPSTPHSFGTGRNAAPSSRSFCTRVQRIQQPACGGRTGSRRDRCAVPRTGHARSIDGDRSCRARPQVRQAAGPSAVGRRQVRTDPGVPGHASPTTGDRPSEWQPPQRALQPRGTASSRADTGRCARVGETQRGSMS